MGWKASASGHAYEFIGGGLRYYLLLFRQFMTKLLGRGWFMGWS